VTRLLIIAWMIEMVTFLGLAAFYFNEGAWVAGLFQIGVFAFLGGVHLLIRRNRRQMQEIIDTLNVAIQIEEHFTGVDPWDKLS
jgi:hypothetical protein